MKSLSEMSGVRNPKTFIHLFCLKDQDLTPHRAGQVTAQRGGLVELELHCRRCGTVVLYETDALPAGYRVYQVRVTGEDNPDLPAEFRPLMPLSEEFAVVATSHQHAHELAEVATTLRFQGHLVRWYIDGEFHPDERF